ncbi:12662_t:CDS:2, partial [Funneliformis geosporum]
IVENTECLNSSGFLYYSQENQLAYNAQKNNTTLQVFYKHGFLQPNPCQPENQSHTFWQAFHDAASNTISRACQYVCINGSNASQIQKLITN